MSPTSIKLEDIFKGTEIPSELSSLYIYSSEANSNERTMAITLLSESLIPYKVIEDFKLGKFIINESDKKNRDELASKVVEFFDKIHVRNSCYIELTPFGISIDVRLMQ